jgi:glycosyltransferase involved in cell wall biosynthesis
MLSICIPTFNRARILDDCLGRLPLFDCEIVVSDNASPDDTRAVVEKHRTYDKRIRYTRLPENQGCAANLRHAVRQARGDLVLYLADDDSLLSEPLATIVGLFERDPELGSVFCDKICWDDAKGIELHRYGFPPQPVEFHAHNQPQHAAELVTWLLATQIPPEIFVARKAVFEQAQIPASYGVEFHVWCFWYAHAAKIRFEPTAFYREHWTLKPGLVRTAWTNQDMAKMYIGHEMRQQLCAIVRLAEFYSGLAFDRTQLFDTIQNFLFNRQNLEIQRAGARGDYIRAVELSREQRLWRWNATLEADEALTQAAAEQAAKLLGLETVEPWLLEAYRV